MESGLPRNVILCPEMTSGLMSTVVEVDVVIVTMSAPCRLDMAVAVDTVVVTGTK